jgi:hypothetical protein
MKLSNKIKKWHQGKPAKDDPKYPEIINAGYVRHWTARVVDAVWGYIKKDYKWLIGVGLIIAGLVLV